MLEKLSRSELLQLMELASRCLTATTAEELAAIISSIYDLTGYKKAALCALSVNGNEVVLAHYVNHSYGAKWAELYASRSFHRVDPIIIHSSTTEGVFRWGETAVPAGGSDFLAAAESFGLTDGVSFSCAGIPPSFRSVLSVTGVPVNEVERIRRVLSVIGPHLHEAYRRVLQLETDRANVVELSAREREVLCWSQQGKTHWEIGSILGISQRTVKFHVARIKAKLDVVSTAHAIAKAMRMGIIT